MAEAGRSLRHALALEAACWPRLNKLAQTTDRQLALAEAFSRRQIMPQLPLGFGQPLPRSRLVRAGTQVIQAVSFFGAVSQRRRKPTPAPARRARARRATCHDTAASGHPPRRGCRWPATCSCTGSRAYMVNGGENGGLWRRLARASEAVSGHPVCRPLPGSAELPRAARHAQEPSWNTAKGAPCPCCRARSSSRASTATRPAATPRSARRCCTQPRSCGSAGRGRPRWRRPASNRSAVIAGQCHGTTPWRTLKVPRRVGVWIDR